MAKTIIIDPVTRLEGHLAIKVKVEGQRVSEAFSKGEMFRGFEMILRGRDPMDAQQITQRICGVCPIAHGTASVLAQDDAYGITLTRNGRLLRNLILGANYIQSHIVHFYQLAALDFVDIAAVLKYQGNDPVMDDLKGWVQRQLDSKLVYPAAPFLPRFEGAYLSDVVLNHMAIRHYLQALEMRRLAHQMVALFAGKVPHAASLIPGGVTEKVTARKIVYYKSKLDTLRRFIDHAYLPDVVGVAKALPGYFNIGKGCGNFMAYGVFPQSDNPRETLFPSGVLIGGQLQPFDVEKIGEQVGFSLFDDRTSGLHPTQGKTEPQPHKEKAYSWLKAPRYGGHVVEVGPLARALVLFHSGKDPKFNQTVVDLLSQVGGKPEHLDSVLGRHAVRALECKIVADQCAEWLAQLVPKEPAFQDFEIPQSGRGVGLTEAPRGALGHWIEIENRKIKNYQCVVPTTWNASPRDDRGTPGPLEQALTGTPVVDSENPLEVSRVVRSFDPCLACAVH